jgi:hypothetical protein
MFSHSIHECGDRIHHAKCSYDGSLCLLWWVLPSHPKRLWFVYCQRENCVNGRDLCSFPFMYCMCERVYCIYRVHEEQSVLFCFQAQYLLVEIRLYSALGLWDLYQTSLCAEDQMLCVCSAPPRWHRMIVAQLSTLCGHTRTHTTPPSRHVCSHLSHPPDTNRCVCDVNRMLWITFAVFQVYKRVKPPFQNTVLAADTCCCANDVDNTSICDLW